MFVNQWTEEMRTFQNDDFFLSMRQRFLRTHWHQSLRRGATKKKERKIKWKEKKSSDNRLIDFFVNKIVKINKIIIPSQRCIYKNNVKSEKRKQRREGVYKNIPPPQKKYICLKTAADQHLVNLHLFTIVWSPCYF